MSTAVVRAVSAVEGREPCSLRPLAYVLDTDALDTLFESRSNGQPRTGGCLSFIYCGCRVSIDNGEYLTIEPLEKPPRASTDGQSHGSGVAD
ncbi:HalOD1 output domain-containing protein [Halegenticoccus tardaugens]|uniref:HalOD1 output domain-containing protein n=1 Tax=Halegenticoccus tardaugens TaxID=2071624 RepID=UPI001E5E798E|nr:HalOD1 output domain-containing protein [Halegenticoccus tardaugens]